jgi:hypothetical protein
MGRPDPGTFESGEDERRQHRIASAITRVLRVADFGTALALAREVQAVLRELRDFDAARELWVRTEGLITEVTSELTVNRRIGPDIYGADGKISSALGVQQQLALQGVGSGPDGYTAGYRAGCDAFRQQVDRRITEIKLNDSDLEIHSVGAHEDFSCRGYWPGFAQVRFDATCKRLPSDRLELREQLSARAAAVLERFQAYSGVSDGLPAARLIVAELSELDDFEVVARNLPKAEMALSKLEHQLAKRWSAAALTIEKIQWRNALAGELREQAAKVSANAGWTGDDFVRGFTMASNRLSGSFRTQADKIAVPDHLCRGLAPSS